MSLTAQLVGLADAASATAALVGGLHATVVRGGDAEIYNTESEYGDDEANAEKKCCKMNAV